MNNETDVRNAQTEALISVIGSMLTVFDIKSDAVELWPETMRRGTAEEIRRVTTELADVLPAALLRALRSDAIGNESSARRTTLGQ